VILRPIYCTIGAYLYAGCGKMAWSIDAVWDIECAEWDRFLVGALWTEADGVRVFREADDLADAIMGLPAGSQVWAHAGGKYDVLWLIDHLFNRMGKRPEAVVSMSGSSAASVKFRGGPWLRDSARLVPMALARAASIAGGGREKGEPGIPCRGQTCSYYRARGKGCGGYCNLAMTMASKWWRLVEEYLVSDVELLRDVLRAIHAYSARQGIELRGTIGGTAWATAQEWCGLEDAEWTREAYAMTAPGYMGGMVGVGYTRAELIYRYDRKSAYPASLLEPVPIGVPKLHHDGVSARRAWGAGNPGIYYAMVEVPESNTPPLPIRHRNRLAFPWGRIDGVWSHVELQHAEAAGCKIERITRAIAWPRERPVLREYAARVFRMRDSLPEPERKALGTWLKFLANSLTGKLGQSPDHKVVRLGDYADDRDYELVGGSPWVWARDVWRIPDCAHVQWAATLTARARVELHEQQTHAGEAWVYSDTDSCFALHPLTRNVGDRIGQWAYEGMGVPPASLGDTWGDLPSPDDQYGWLCEAPKVYAYNDPERGEKIAHAKGIPDSERIVRWLAYSRGELVSEDRGVLGLKNAARAEKLFKRRTLSRRLHRNEEWCGARLRGEGHRTRAPHVTALSGLK